MPEPIVIDRERLALLPKSKQDKALQALKDLEHSRRENPLLFYRPHKKQATFHSFTAKNKVFIGGNQSGKTTCGSIDSIIQAIDEDVVPDHLKQFKHNRPPFRCWIAGNTREVVEMVIFQKLQEWIPPSQLVGDSWTTAYDKQLHTLHFKNGSTFAFKTYEQEEDKWGGASVDRVMLDEEPPAGHLREARIRTMAREGDLVYTFTPTNGISHMYDWLSPYIERADNNDDHLEDSDVAIVLVEMDDNPTLTEREKELALVGFSKEQILARKLGRFVALHGLIYNEFQPDRHVIPAMNSVPENVNVIVGIDPGIRHACGVLWTYVAQDGTIVAFEEGYFKDMTIAQVCQEIHKTNAHYGVDPLFYVIDPAARNRSSQTGRSDQMEFMDNGITTIPGQNSVTAGINNVKVRLEADKLLTTENCENLIREIKRYRWRKPGRSESDAPEAPVKTDDHLCFVAGTMVETETGPRAIESIRPGDKVWTRNGLHPVSAWAQTHPDAEIWEGAGLRGTGNHPIWTVNRGWVRLDSLRYSDKILRWKEKNGSGTESSFIATPTRPANTPVNTSPQPPSGFTAPYGRQKMAPFPRATTFTTLTATPVTTTLETWNVSLRANTCGCTLRKTRSGASKHERICGRSNTLQKRGTKPSMGSSGTENMGGRTFNGSPRQKIATTAGTPTKPSVLAGGSAPTSARPHGGWRGALTTLKRFVSSVRKPLLPTNTQRPELVVEFAGESYKVGRSAVYNLTVAGPSEYFANGVLVSNCDPLRYICMARPYAPKFRATTYEKPLDKFKRDDWERVVTPPPPPA